MAKVILCLYLLFHFYPVFSEDNIFDEKYYLKDKENHNTKPVLMYKIFSTQKNDLKFEAHYFYKSGLLFCKWVMDNEKLITNVSYYNENEDLIGMANFKGRALKPGENIDSPNWGLMLISGLDIDYRFDENELLIIKSIRNYSNGKLEGSSFEFYYDKNGQRQVKSVGNYKAGKAEGVYVEYYENTGYLKSICNYKNDIVFGPTSSFDEKGRLIHFCTINSMNKTEGSAINIVYNNEKVETLEMSYSQNDKYLYSVEIKDGYVTKSNYNKKGLLIDIKKVDLK